MARAVGGVGLGDHLLVFGLALFQQRLALLQHALLFDLLVLKTPGLAWSVRRVLHKLVERVAGGYRRRSPAIETRADGLTRRQRGSIIGLGHVVQWIDGATVRVRVSVFQHDVRLYRPRRQRIVGKRERAPRLVVSLRLGCRVGIVLVENTGTFRGGVLALLLSHGETT